jgi:hypothetical protein
MIIKFCEKVYAGSKVAQSAYSNPTKLAANTVKGWGTFFGLMFTTWFQQQLA